MREIINIEVSIFFPQPCLCQPLFLSFFNRRCSPAFFDWTLFGKLHCYNKLYLSYVQQPNSESNSQDNQPCKANAISYILQTSPFPGMINLCIREKTPVLHSDEFIIYLCVKCFSSSPAGYCFCFVGRVLRCKLRVAFLSYRFIISLSIDAISCLCLILF